MNKKVAAIGLASGLALGAAGAAFAYFTDTGNRTGRLRRGSRHRMVGSERRRDLLSWSVTLYPGQGTNTISAVVQQGAANQGLNRTGGPGSRALPSACQGSRRPGTCDTS